MNAGDLEVMLKLRDEMSAALARAVAAMGGAEKAAQAMATAIRQAGDDSRAASSHLLALGSAAQSTSGFLSHAAATAAGFVAAHVVIKDVSAAFDAVKDSVIGFNSQMENAQIGFTAFTGSASLAAKTLDDLKQFAVTTPFRFPELVDSSQKLLAFGFAAKDLIPIMTAVGDVVAATGTVSAEKLNRVTLALGEIGTTGKVMERQMLQFTEAGIPAFDILSKGLGVTTGHLRDMIQKGLVPADEAIKILVEGMENRAPGAMDKMSHTLTGAVSNIQDSFQQLSAGALKPVYDDLRGMANAFADLLGSDKVKGFATEVANAFTTLNAAMRAAFSGNREDARTFFASFGSQAQDMAKEVELAFLHIADSFAPAVEPITEMFAGLVADALVWGGNLITAFASGMISAAGSVLNTVMNEIANAIADFLKSFSPPKKGPLREINLWGANLLTSYFEGMRQADFSALDDVMKAVKDVLDIQMSQNVFPKEGLIPRLVGAEAGVAMAISDVREFGTVSEATFAVLEQHLGPAAQAVADLAANFTQLADMQSQMKDLDRQIKDFDGDIRQASRAVADAQRPITALDEQIAHLTRTFDDQKRPIEEAIDAATRYYDRHIRGADEAVRAIDRQIAAVHRLHQPELDQLTTQERGLNLAIAQQTLAEAQGAAPLRAQRLQQDVTSAGLSLQGAQHARATLAPTATALDIAGANNAVEQANLHLQEAQQKLHTEGLTTERDRLNILNAQRGVIEAQVAVEATGLEAQKSGLQAELDKLKDEKDNAVIPLKDHLDDITQAHKDAVNALENQKIPLQDNLKLAQDHLNLLQDQRQALADQKSDLEDQLTPLQDALTLVQTRLSHEKEIATEIEKQTALLASQAGGGGGAGAHHAVPGGSTDLSHLGLNIAARAGAPIAQQLPPPYPIGTISTMDKEIAALGQKVSDQFKKSVKEGFEQGFDGFSKADAVFTAAGAIIGFKMGGPMGAAMGVAASVSFRDHFESNTREQNIGAGWGAILLGGLTLFLTKSPQFAVIAATIGAGIGEKLVPAMLGVGGDLVEGIKEGVQAKWFGLEDWIGGLGQSFIAWVKNPFGIASPSTVMADIGGELVDGLKNGIGDKWKTFQGWLGDRVQDGIDTVKTLLGISSPSTVFHGIGTDIMTGLQNGVEEIWKTTKQWFADLPGNIVSAVGTVTETLLEKGRDLLQGMSRGIAQIWIDTGGVKDWLADLGKIPGGRIADAVGSLGQVLVSAGRQVIQGLLDGMKSWWDTYAQPFLNSISTAITNVKNAYDNLPKPGNLPGGAANPLNWGQAAGPIQRLTDVDIYGNPITPANRLPFFAGRTPALGAGDIQNYAANSPSGQAAAAFWAALGIHPGGPTGIPSSGGFNPMTDPPPPGPGYRFDPVSHTWIPTAAVVSGASGGSASPFTPDSGLLLPGQPRFGNPTNADQGTSLGLSLADATMCLNNPFAILPDGSRCYEHTGALPWQMFDFGRNARPATGITGSFGGGEGGGTVYNYTINLPNGTILGGDRYRLAQDLRQILGEAAQRQG